MYCLYIYETDAITGGYGNGYNKWTGCYSNGRLCAAPDITQFFFNKKG